MESYLCTDQSAIGQDQARICFGAGNISIWFSQQYLAQACPLMILITSVEALLVFGLAYSL